MYLPGRFQNSHRNGGSVFLIFVADPRTAHTPSPPARDFDQRAHDAGQGLTGRGAVGGDRHGDSEFEVVAGVGSVGARRTSPPQRESCPQLPASRNAWQKRCAPSARPQRVRPTRPPHTGALCTPPLSTTCSKLGPARLATRHLRCQPLLSYFSSHTLLAQ